MRNAVLVLVDGTICDDRHRLQYRGTPAFAEPSVILRDRPVPGSVECLRELDRLYRLLYLSARPDSLWEITAQWMTEAGFPFGELQTAPSAAERLAIAREMSRRYHIAAGIGNRPSDNELHLELGCKSIILQEYEGNWEVVRRHLLNSR